MTEQHRFVWIDCETTGLDETDPEARLLELAVVFAADAPGDTLEVVESYNFVFAVPTVPKTTDLFVVGMHTKNGLWAECAQSEFTYTDVDQFLAVLMTRKSGGPVKPRSLTMAGNSVHFDLRWVKRFLPAFGALFSHRVADCSALALFCEAYGTEFTKPPKAEAHRALPDVLESLAYLRHLRGWLK